MPKQDFASAAQFVVPWIEDSTFYIAIEGLTGNERKYTQEFHPLMGDKDGNLKRSFAQVAQSLKLRNDKLKLIIKSLPLKKVWISMMSEKTMHLDFMQRTQYYQLSDLVDLYIEKGFIVHKQKNTNFNIIKNYIEYLQKSGIDCDHYFLDRYNYFISSLQEAGAIFEDPIETYYKA